MNSKVQVDLKWIGSHQNLPKYATPGSAALDLIADIEAPLTVYPGQRVMISSGLSIHVKDPNVAAILLPRSGLGTKHGIVLGNLVGLVDSDYTGPCSISLWNSHEENAYTVQPGERVCQLMLIPVLQANFNEVAFHMETERGEGGFGSTGAV